MGRDGWTLVRAGYLIDGTGTAAVQDVGVLIHGERIVAVEPFDSIEGPTDAPVRRIDLSDSTVAPGLIDCHLHVGYCGHRNFAELEWPLSLEYSAVCAGANATMALHAGYTAGLDVGCRGNVAVAVREAIAQGVIAGPHLRVSGRILSTVGGALDGWPSSIRLDPGTRLAAIVSGVEEIRREIREQAKAGVDNVKLQITRSTVQSQRGGRSSTFTASELEVASQTAHDQGLSISAHAEGPEGIRDAIEAGFDTIQHASFIDDPTIDVLEAHPRSRLVFTLGVYDAIIERGEAIGYPPQMRARVVGAWQRLAAGVRRAYERGVPFTVGSDAGGVVHPHGRYARDIVLLVRACSLSVEEAIRAATRDAAAAAWHAETGTLSPGGYADLIAVRGALVGQVERLEDPANLSLVMKRGTVV